MTKHLHPTGFTLIELLIVISIIGLLASVVFAALATARNNAKAGVVTSELIQFRNLYELNYDSTQGYGALQPSSFAFCSQYPSSTGYYCTAQSLSDCSALFDPTTGVMKSSDALNICKNIVNNQLNTGSIAYFEIGVASNVNLTQKYSVYAYLPGQSKSQCFGSSKLSSTIAAISHAAGGDNFPGCSGNP